MGRLADALTAPEQPSTASPQPVGRLGEALLSLGAPERSGYMSGPWWQDALDVVGTGGFASAGVANALMQGNNPLAGALEGIQKRMSYSDVLTNAGAPDNFLTHAAGFAGDVFLDPTNLLFGAGTIAHARSAAATLLGGVGHLTGLERMADLAKGLDAAVVSAGRAQELAAQASKRIPGGIRRALYNKAIGTVATQVARDPVEIVDGAKAARAAALEQALGEGFERPQALQIAQEAQRTYLNGMLGEDAHKTVKLLQNKYIGEFAAGKREAKAAAAATLRGWQAEQGTVGDVLRGALQDTEKTIKQRPHRFGEVGAVLVDQVASMFTKSDAWIGAKFAHPAWDVLSHLSEQDAKLLDKFGRAVEDGVQMDVPDHIKQAYNITRNLLDSVGTDAVEQGLPLVDQGLSVALQSLKPNQQERVIKIVRKPALLDKFRPTKAMEAARSLAQEIMQRGGSISTRLDNPLVVRPFEMRQNYWLRKMRDDVFEALRKNPEGPEGQRMIAEIVAKEGVSEDAAKAMLHQQLGIGRSTPREIRMGNLQFSRELPIPEEFIDPDFRQNLAKYIHGSGLRLAAANTFGSADELGTDLLKVAQQNGYDHATLRKLFNSAVGGLESPDQWMKVVGDASTMRFLGPRTALSQFLQFPNAVGAFGMKHAVAGLGSYLTRDGHKLAQEIGATLADMKELYGGTGKLAERFMQMTAMPTMDRAMRVVSSTAAYSFAKDGAEAVFKLAGQPNKARELAIWERGLARLGLTKETILRQGGQLTAEQLRMAALVGSTKTQFASHLQDLPLAYQNKWGRFFLKFKTFSLQSGKFLDDFLLAEVKKRNFVPAARWALSMGIVGGPIWSILRHLQRNPKDPTALDAFKTIYFTGALGAVADYSQAISQGDKDRTISALVGPNVGLIGELASLPFKVAQGKASLSDVPLNYFQQARNLWNNSQE